MVKETKKCVEMIKSYEIIDNRWESSRANPLIKMLADIEFLY